MKRIQQIQKDFDDSHGWNLKSNDIKEKIESINKDLIGLFGEIGEFSNLVKKINLLENEGVEEYENGFNEKEARLKEELVDSFIYLIRISTHLKMDIEKEYLGKMKINKEKYKKFLK